MVYPLPSKKEVKGIKIEVNVVYTSGKWYI